MKAIVSSDAGGRCALHISSVTNPCNGGRDQGIEGCYPLQIIAAGVTLSTGAFDMSLGSYMIAAGAIQ